MTLAAFPPEILEQIFSHLACSCAAAISSSDPSEIEWPRVQTWRQIAAYKTNANAILNLTLVCRRFRVLAQPISVMHFHLRPRLFLFLRTLRERPDLRGAVKLLDVNAIDNRLERRRIWNSPFHNEEELSGGEDDAEGEYAGLDMCEYLEMIKEMEEEGGWGYGDVPVIRLGWYYDFMLDTTPEDVEETLMQFLLAMLPNLEHVRLQIPSWWTFRRLHARRMKGEILAVAAAAAAVGWSGGQESDSETEKVEEKHKGLAILTKVKRLMVQGGS